MGRVIDFGKADMASMEAELSNRVYAAALLLEELERAGKVRGNGHHAAQRIAEFASDVLRDMWISGVTMESREHG